MEENEVHAVSGWELRAIPAYGAALLYLKYFPVGGGLDARRFGCALDAEQLARLRRDIDTALLRLRPSAAQTR
jgi:hypothetical protein